MVALRKLEYADESPEHLLWKQDFNSVRLAWGLKFYQRGVGYAGPWTTRQCGGLSYRLGMFSISGHLEFFEYFSPDRLLLAFHPIDFCLLFRLTVLCGLSLFNLSGSLCSNGMEILPCCKVTAVISEKNSLIMAGVWKIQYSLLFP